METDPGIALEKMEQWIQGFYWILPNLGIALVVMFLFWLISLAVRHSIHRVFRARGRGDLGQLLAGFSRWALLGLGLLVMATIVFPSVKPADILATLGIGSIAIGFAFKDILQNWLAGLLLLLREPFRRGDQIKIGDFEGSVEHIKARATLLRTYDGRRIVIPNSDVYTRAVIVNTAFPKRRSDYDVGIGYGDDIEKARRVILEALRSAEGVEADPEPDVIPWELAGSTVNLKVRWWTASDRRTVVTVRGRVIEAIKQAVTGAGIDLPFPTQVVLFHDQTEETDGDRSRQREGWPAGDTPPKARHLNEVTVVRHDQDEEREAAKTPEDRPGRFFGRSRG